MAKKKKAAKKTNRKAATRKKPAAKRSSRKTTRKTTQKSRKPAARTKTKSAKTRKSPRTSRATSGSGNPPVPPVPYTVTVATCDINPPSQHFSEGDYVFFNCSAACILDFSDPTVLGLNGFAQQMQQGNNRFQVVVPSGSTTVSISGCQARATGPADIIVP